MLPHIVVKKCPHFFFQVVRNFERKKWNKATIVIQISSLSPFSLCCLRCPSAVWSPPPRCPPCSCPLPPRTSHPPLGRPYCWWDASSVRTERERKKDMCFHTCCKVGWGTTQWTSPVQITCSSLSLTLSLTLSLSHSLSFSLSLIENEQMYNRSLCVCIRVSLNNFRICVHVCVRRYWCMFQWSWALTLHEEDPNRKKETLLFVFVLDWC